MMNKKNDYIWMFSVTALKAGFDGPFSLEYHVPESKMLADAASILDSRIWLVLKNADRSYLFAFIVPTSIERYEDGPYKGDFLLHADPYCSVRLLPRFESHDPWTLDDLKNHEDGIRECSDAEETMFLSILSRNQRISFSDLSRSTLDSIPKTRFSDAERAVPEQLKLVLRTMAFGDLSRSKSAPAAVSAFGNATLLLLLGSIENIDSPELVKLIALMDPLLLNSGGELRSPKEILRESTNLPPTVDMVLEEIDPKKISPRTFIARSDNHSSDWLDKTCDAEKRHEDILKDIVIYLNDNGHKAFQSRSFDLFTEIRGSKCLWEIKSTNHQNVVGQGEKGLIQLLRYSAALADTGNDGVRFLLLLQFSNHNGELAYLLRMAKTIGIELWIYDNNRDWPHRVYSFDAGKLLAV